MEISNDNILFGMPEDPEMFLAALAAVQDYEKQLKKQKSEGRKRDGWFLAVHSPNQALDFLKPCFPEEVAFVDEWEPRRGDWDYVYRFDSEVAYQLSVPTQQHVTAAFGIMIGADPAQLPDLSALKFKKPKGQRADIWLLEGTSGELLELCQTHFPELYSQSGVGSYIEGLFSLENRIALAADANLAIGKRSFETYAAAALGKTVLELYPDDRHQKWLSKWTGKYQMIVGNNFPVELVWRGFESLLDRYPICPETKSVGN